jgi:hypothetical protein
MDKLKGFLRRGEDEENPSNVEEERGFVADALDASSLSWSTRIKGFLACFVVGVCISILSTVMFALTYNLVTFSVLYTLGNLVALSSTLFLMGPINQVKRMFAPTRLIATCLMIGFLALTLCSAFWWQKKGLTILFCIMQFCAMTWYSISYIPYARDAIKKAADSCLG